MFIKKKAALLLLLVATSAAAQDFDNVVVDIDCNLSKIADLNRSVIYRGDKTAIGCKVVVPVKDFDKKYSYCALSGLYKSSGSSHICSFGIYDADRTQVHFSTAKATCEFVCIKRGAL